MYFYKNLNTSIHVSYTCLFNTFILRVSLYSRSLPSMFIYSSDYYRKTNTRIFDFVKSFFEIGNIIFKISTSEHVYSSQKQSNIRGKIITPPIFLSNTLSYLSTRILEFAIEFSKTCDINYRVVPPAFTQRFSGSRWNTVSKSSPAGYV